MNTLPITPEPSENKLIADEARRLFEAGILTFPATEEAKHPDRIDHWGAEYYPPNGWPLVEQHTRFFQKSDVKRLFVVCGGRSGNVATLDFDQAGYFDQWAKLIPDELLDRLYIEESQRSGGFHVTMRTTQAVPPCVPARDPRKPDDTDGHVRIEVRGEGNGFMAAPSMGYQRLSGDLANLPVLTADEYQILLDAAATFNQYVPPPPKEQKPRTVRSADADERPGDRYNRESGQSEVLAVFQQHGWKIGARGQGNVSITHPNATTKTSGNVNAKGVTCIFSTNTPFEASVTDDGKGHAPFHVYATLEHGGDYQAAAKALSALYDPQPKRRVKAHNRTVGAAAKADEEQERMAATDNVTIDAEPGEVFAGRPLSDLGNAERLQDMFGDRIRYCSTLGVWYIWDGTRWGRDDRREINRLAATTVRSIYREAAGGATAGEREASAKHALRSEAAAKIDAMISTARSLSGIVITESELNTDRWALNCDNGTLDLRTGELRAHNPADLISKKCPVVYDPDARLPLWDQFLAQATKDDAAYLAFLQRAAGYTLCGEPMEEVMFFPHGPAATGKSTFLDALKATLGEYAMTADFEAFIKKQGDAGVRPDIARLAGARFVVSVEVDEGKKLAEGLVKMITGGDTVTARELYKKAFEFRPDFTLWLAANHAPKVRNDDDAMWRRIIRLPFTRIVPKAERDPKVKATLRNPAVAGAAILAWAVRGCLEWQRDGLGVPPVVEKATEDYRSEMNVLSGFLADCCAVRPNAWISTNALYVAYDKWGRAGNEKQLLTKTEFGRQLSALGYTEKRTSAARGWNGIALLGADTQETIDDWDNDK